MRTALILAVISLPLGAQQWTPTITWGTRVRVGTETGPIEGRYYGTPGDSVRVAMADGAVLYSVPVQRVFWIDVSEGRARVKGVAIGAVAGLVVGTVLGAVIGSYADPDPGSYSGFIGMLMGIVIGIPSGMIGGGLFARERWTRHFNPNR